MVVPGQFNLARRRGEVFGKKLSRLHTPVSEIKDRLRWHVEIDAALFFIVQTDMGDTVSIARKTRLHVVGPVSQRIDERAEKPEKSIPSATLIEIGKELRDPALILVGHKNRIVRMVGMKC